MTCTLQLNIPIFAISLLSHSLKRWQGKKKITYTSSFLICIHVQIYCVINHRFIVLLEIQPHKCIIFNSQPGSDLAALEGWGEEVPAKLPGCNQVRWAGLSAELLAGAGARLQYPPTSKSVPGTTPFDHSKRF